MSNNTIPPDLAIATGSRISQQTFTVVQFFFLGIAIVATAAKIGVRLRWRKRLSVDDGILCVSVVFLTASFAVFYTGLDLVYSLFTPGASQLPEQLLQLSRVADTSAVLSWTTIFLVKLSFVWFFHDLTDRLPRMRRHWWIVTSLVVACAPIDIFMTFYICGKFNVSGIRSCGVGIDYRSSVYVNLTAAIDIFTDILILSIPIGLLWKVKIDLRRKLGLAAVLCLSVVMMTLQIVRVSMSYTTVPMLVPAGPDGQMQLVETRQLDQSWMFFWLNIESAVAIVMVAVTAFKSMLGRKPTVYAYHEEKTGLSGDEETKKWSESVQQLDQPSKAYHQGAGDQYNMLGGIEKTITHHVEIGFAPHNPGPSSFYLSEASGDSLSGRH